MPDLHPGDAKGYQLRLYWTKGKGLARWASSPTPYRTLVAALLSEGLTPNLSKRLAASYFHDVFHIWPGTRFGKDPLGPG